MSNHWQVITGAPSSGKSTIINALAGRGYKTIEEMGKKLIDQDMAAGKKLAEINVDSPEFEERWIKLQVEAESRLDPNELIFFDRAVIDTLGYFDCYNWPLTPYIKEQTDHASYERVFLLQMLNYDKDYYRVEDEDTAKELQASFLKMYETKGYDVVIIPPDSVENRLDKILSFLK